jgi:hypothetical protein
VGGRIKSDFRFNNRLVYNTFPFVDLNDRNRRRVEEAAAGLLAARSDHPQASLADLYDPLATPADLIAAHRSLDRAVDLAFSARRRFTTDADRLQFLLDRYVRVTAADQLLPVTSQRRSRRRNPRAD